MRAQHSMDHMQAIKDIAGIERFHSDASGLVSLDARLCSNLAKENPWRPIAIRKIDDTPWSSIVT